MSASRVRISRARVAQGLSQEALNLLTECEPSSTGRIERGRENTTVETLEALAGVLGAPLMEFFVVPEVGAVRPGRLKPGPKPRT